MSLHLDVLRDLWGPGLVFLFLVFWLVRKAWKAARTEGELEHEREYYAAQALRDRERAASESPASSDAISSAGGAIASGGASSSGSRPRAVPDVSEDPLAGADLSHARADHVAAVTALLLAETPRPPVEILWVRSLGPHAAWLEKGLAGSQRLRVAKVEAGTIVERWTFE